MLFGKEDYFTKEHFEKNSGYAPPYLCELVVYCMELLSNFSSFGLDFRFKGGNSLLLMLDKPNRFSVDIDIDSSETKERLIEVMETIAERSPKFTKLDIRQHKTKPWLPMISFNIFFNSLYQQSDKSFVMLDAVLKKTPYDGYRKKISVGGSSGELYSSDVDVEISTNEGIMGDKLLTIGPATLGIPVGKGKEAQRLKHVFDLSRLMKDDLNWDKVSESVRECMVQENNIQRSSFSLAEVTLDTEKFCSSILEFDEIPDVKSISFDEEPYRYEIVYGFEEFSTYLFNMKYSWDNIKEDMRNVIGILDKLK